jgi:curli production assembly/transport component CsgG
MVSTKTGEVLLTSETSSTIFSYQVSSDLFRFFDMNQSLIEAEAGMAANESPNIAVRRAVELAVIDIIEKGFDRSLWSARRG